MKIRPFARLLLGVSLLPFLSAAAVAQETLPAPKTSDAPEAKSDATTDKTDTTVTVTANKPVNRIDRQVYDAKSDIGNQTGTAADALNKVPSINVDNDGNVTLRGQSGVKIMVDGRSNAQMSGDNRAAAIQSMSASDIDSIEVINNPSAAFGSEGSGGIINIVMRKNRKPGKSGAFIASVGAKDRYNAALTGSYNSGKYTISGGVSLRKDGRKFTGQTQRDSFNQVSTDVRNSVIDSSGLGHRDNLSANFALDYNLNDSDTLGLSLSQSNRSGDSESVEHTITKNGSGTIIEDFTRQQTSDNPGEDGQIKVRFDHKGKDNAETLKFDATYSTSNNSNDRLFTNHYLVGGLGSDVKNRQVSVNDTVNAAFNGDYGRNVGPGQLGLGFAFEQNTSLYDNAYYGISAGGAQSLNAQFTNRFEIERWQKAAYFTYQRPLNDKWTIMGGLRFENTVNDYNQVTTAVRGSHSFSGYYPSFFAAYSLSEQAKLRFSYSKRSQKPNDNDLNPFMTYVDAQNVSTGNVNLDPQLTHSYEIGYEYGQKGVNIALRGFYRKNLNVITDYSYFVTPDVLLTTKQNGGKSQSGGIEFSYTGILSPTLKANINGNANYTELTSVTGSTTIKNAVSLSGRVGLDYTLTPKDRLQFMAGMMGKQLTGQGYRKAALFSNISYRHQVTPKLALVATLNDPFETMKFKTVTETTYVKSTSERTMGGRVFYIGLSYTFGGAKADDQVGPPMGRGMRGMGPGPGGPM